MALIGVEELSARIERGDDDLVVCDVRFDLFNHDAGRRRYESGHLPGAAFVDLHTDLATIGDGGPSTGGRHPLPSTAEFSTMIGSIGISPESFVVAYDDVGGAFAARLWWMLRAIGHEHVAVLDGGIQAWERADLALETTPAARRPTQYPVPGSWPGVVSADDVQAAIDAGRVVIDSRAPERYSGATEPLDTRAGHIPGAINIHHGANLDADGHHLPVPELRERFNVAADSESPIVYCGSGVSACHNLLVMCVLGIAEPGEALLYPGSWSEWSANPHRPVATGD